MPRVLIEQLHKWTCGTGRAQGSVVLTHPPEDATEEHARFLPLSGPPRRAVPLLFLTELWVPTHARGQGTAGTLLAAVVRWADKAGVDLWLYCSEHGPAPRLNRTQLQALYAKHGFKRVSMNSPDVEMLRRARN